MTYNKTSRNENRSKVNEFRRNGLKTRKAHRQDTSISHIQEGGEGEGSLLGNIGNTFGAIVANINKAFKDTTETIETTLKHNDELAKQSIPFRRRGNVNSRPAEGAQKRGDDGGSIDFDARQRLDDETQGTKDDKMRKEAMTWYKENKHLKWFKIRDGIHHHFWNKYTKETVWYLPPDENAGQQPPNSFAWELINHKHVSSPDSIGDDSSVMPLPQLNNKISEALQLTTELERTANTINETASKVKTTIDKATGVIDTAKAAAEAIEAEAEAEAKAKAAETVEAAQAQAAAEAEAEAAEAAEAAAQEQAQAEAAAEAEAQAQEAQAQEAEAEAEAEAKRLAQEQAEVEEALRLEKELRLAEAARLAEALQLTNELERTANTINETANTVKTTIETARGVIETAKTEAIAAEARAAEARTAEARAEEARAEEARAAEARAAGARAAEEEARAAEARAAEAEQARHGQDVVSFDTTLTQRSDDAMSRARVTVEQIRKKVMTDLEKNTPVVSTICSPDICSPDVKKDVDIKRNKIMRQFICESQSDKNVRQGVVFRIDEIEKIVKEHEDATHVNQIVEDILQRTWTRVERKLQRTWTNVEHKLKKPIKPIKQTVKKSVMISPDNELEKLIRERDKKQQELANLRPSWGNWDELLRHELQTEIAELKGQIAVLENKLKS